MINLPLFREDENYQGLGRGWRHYGLGDDTWWALFGLGGGGMMHLVSIIWGWENIANWYILDEHYALQTCGKGVLVLLRENAPPFYNNINYNIIALAVPIQWRRTIIILLLLKAPWNSLWRLTAITIAANSFTSRWHGRSVYTANLLFINSAYTSSIQGKYKFNEFQVWIC